MAEDNKGNMDLEGAQNFLNDLLNNNTNTPTDEESSEDIDEKIDVKDAEALKKAANLDDVDEELDPKQVQKLIDFVGGEWKDRTPDNLDDDELDRLTKIAVVKAGHFNYNPKKHFGVQYKKKRQRRNKMAKTSRAANRR